MSGRLGILGRDLLAMSFAQAIHDAALLAPIVSIGGPDHGNAAPTKTYRPKENDRYSPDAIRRLNAERGVGSRKKVKP